VRELAWKKENIIFSLLTNFVPHPGPLPRGEGASERGNRSIAAAGITLTSAEMVKAFILSTEYRSRFGAP